MTPTAGKGEQQKLYPPFAQPDPGRRSAAEAAEVAGPLDQSEHNEPLEPSSLPSIDQFLDELPSIEDFLIAPSPPVAQAAAPPAAPSPVPSPGPELDSEGWASGAWQSYDWNRVALLGAPAPEAVEANAAWSSTDWDSSRRVSKTGEQSDAVPAGEIAAALDEMARRIRSGELSLERFYGTPPEAAIAAVFAALLRTRR